MGGENDAALIAWIKSLDKKMETISGQLENLDKRLQKLESAYQTDNTLHNERKSRRKEFRDIAPLWISGFAGVASAYAAVKTFFH